MMKTIEEIISFHTSYTKQNPKIIVWAHNSHVGDARATQMGTQGEINIGQLAKEKFGKKAFSVGFTTYTGTVSAASEWGAPVERKYVRSALPDSLESILHALQISSFYFIFSRYKSHVLDKQLIQRAIGVVYLPQSERMSHYFYANVTQQFDALVYFDITHALIPLDKSSEWEKGEDLPETYPFGL